MKRRVRAQAWINVAVCVAACMLVLAASIGGTTFAWVASTAYVGDTGAVGTTPFGAPVGSAEFATLGLSLEASTPEVYGFQRLGASTLGLSGQVALLQDLKDLDDQQQKDELFTAWCRENFGDDTILQPLQQAGQYAMLRREYTFSYEADIPSYFKIGRGVDDAGMDIALAAFWSKDGGANWNTFEYDPASECYYITEPFGAGAESIAVSFTAILLDLNGASGGVDFGSAYAEIIQATNNAAYFREGWEDIAAAGKLVPYTGTPN